MEIVKLYLFDSRTSGFDNIFSSLFLSDEDIDHLERYKIEEVKKEKALSLHFKNKYIGEYSINEYGKPISKNIFFNISHSHGIVVLATSSKYDVGVDIEVIRDKKDDLARFVSNEEEYQYIKSDKNFFEVWTSKESLSKCVGTGIRNNIKSIPSFPLNGRKIFNNEVYYNKLIEKDDYVISITLHTKEDFEIEVEELKR